jgi:arabinose-5-phosphate isomerase
VCDPEEMPDSALDLLECAQFVMRTEAEALSLAAERLGQTFLQAVDLLLLRSPANKLVVTGIGKSGHVAMKAAGTFCSTGTPALFLHPADAVHGDLGIYTPGDPTVLISKSGATEELVRLVPRLRQLSSPLIGILGNIRSPLAQQVDVVLDATVQREADPHNLAPTASTAVAMALGDALAMALMQARQFTREDFARYHPGGQLGRNLQLRVESVMHPPERTAQAGPLDYLKQIVVTMTRFPLGAACIISPEGNLLGLITDGDLRRALREHDDIRPLRAADLMTPSPITISPHELVGTAMALMENRPSQISVLPVVDAGGRYLGLLRLHDIYQPRRESTS